jgi:predicted transcriptional regulator
MKTVILEVASRERTKKRILKAFKGEPQGAFISFESPDILFKTLSGKRWELIKIMTGAGPMTIREAARRLNRDVKAVHGDIQVLLKTGILQKTEDNLIVFPYDVIHVDFMLKAA